MFSFLQSHPDGVYLTVKVQPRSSSNQIGAPIGNALKIKVTAPPVDSAANQAVIEILSRRLDCPKSMIRLVNGQTSRIKTVYIQEFTVEMVVERLNLKAGPDSDEVPKETGGR
ncbi:MAG: DUF167 domain-containing protein [Opitutaceae bacterium]|nr:DUF167 domain-containing protein [Verrucomicrobiales bacterium]